MFPENIVYLYKEHKYIIYTRQVTRATHHVKAYPEIKSN